MADDLDIDALLEAPYDKVGHPFLRVGTGT